MKWLDFDSHPRGRELRNHRRHYLPWYDDTADYNTNSKSYYDYLAKMSELPRLLVDFINRLMDRDIEVIDSQSIDLTKSGNWQDNGSCSIDGKPSYDDTITLKADVIISNESETVTISEISETSFNVKNGSKIKSTGLWSPDYRNVLNGINTVIGTLKNKINDLINKVSSLTNKVDNLETEVSNLKTDITNLQEEINNLNNTNNNLTNALAKILNNLYKGGAINSPSLSDFEFEPNRTIASGNINLFGGTADGNSYIRTNKGQSENDLVGGI